MSLVNDALKKARMEAARGEVAKRGIPYPVLGRGQSPSTARPVLIGIAFVALALVGYLLYSAGQRSALDEARAGEGAAGPHGAPALGAERSEPADGLGGPFLSGGKNRVGLLKHGFLLDVVNTRPRAQGNRAVIWLDFTGDHLNERRFTAAVGTD